MGPSSYIANGAPMPVMAAGRDEAETEKRIVMLLLKGLTMWSIDNVNGALEGDFLCQVITQPQIHIRKLGVSEGPEPDMLNSLTPYATGNNVRLVGDMPRRGIISTMDANMERPELRTLETKPHKLIMANRGRYIADCLTIPLAYRLAGSPGKLMPQLAGFEEWSDTAPASAGSWARAAAVAVMARMPLWMPHAALAWWWVLRRATTQRACCERCERRCSHCAVARCDHTCGAVPRCDHTTLAVARRYRQRSVSACDRSRRDALAAC